MQQLGTGTEAASDSAGSSGRFSGVPCCHMYMRGSMQAFKTQDKKNATLHSPHVPMQDLTPNDVMSNFTWPGSTPRAERAAVNNILIRFVQLITSGLTVGLAWHKLLFHSALGVSGTEFRQGCPDCSSSRSNNLAFPLSGEVSSNNHDLRHVARMADNAVIITTMTRNEPKVDATLAIGGSRASRKSPPLEVSFLMTAWAKLSLLLHQW